MSVGTLMRGTSLRKSVNQVGTHAAVPVAEAPTATFQFYPTTSSLTGFAEAPAVVAEGPRPGLEQGRCLLLPGSTAEWKAVDEHDGATRAVVLVVELDGPRVLLTNIDVRHESLLSSGSDGRALLRPTAQMRAALIE